MTVALSALVAGTLAWALTWAYLRAMHARMRLEPPSERGMHSVAKPTGAGAVIVPVSIGTWSVANWGTQGNADLTLIAAALSLMMLSWVDDQRGGLPPLLRLAAHAAAVAALLFQLDEAARAAPWLPLPLERLALAVAWLWLINLFNFMDGIDGLAGSETIFVALGYWMVATATGVATALANFGPIVAAAAAGYLVWNRPPARVMMGDAGSIPFGFLLGWLLIDLLTRGLWAAALILPLYFAADATLTLFARLLRGEKLWQPHREHFYQRAAIAGMTPAQVVARVSIANVCLVALALLSVVHPLPALGAACLVVACLLVHLGQTARRKHQKTVQE